MSKIKRIPYMGSKNKIAPWVLDTITANLEADKKYNLVDIFGGGGSITTCAVENYSHKFDSVLYNELNKSIFELFKLLTKGSAEECEEFFEAAKVWVSREQFKAEYTQANAWGGFLQSCWSFGNLGRNYLFGLNTVSLKKLGHEVVVDKNKEAVKELGLEFDDSFWNEEIINVRRFIFKREVRRLNSEGFRNINQLQHLENINQLKELSNIKPSMFLSVSNADFRAVTIPFNAVVYCDAPYKGTAEYTTAMFPDAEYSDWLQELTTRGVPVFVSEYNLEVEGFTVVAEIEKRSMLNPTGHINKTERLYWNGVK